MALQGPSLNRREMLRTSKAMEEDLSKRDPSSKIALASQQESTSMKWSGWGSWAVEEWQEKDSETTEVEPEPAPGLSHMDQASSMLPADLLEDIGFDEKQDEKVATCATDVSNTMTALMSVLGKNAGLRYQSGGQTISLQEVEEDDAGGENLLQAPRPSGGTFEAGYQNLYSEDVSDYYCDQYSQLLWQHHGHSDATTYDSYSMAHLASEGWGSTWGHDDNSKHMRQRKQPMVGRFCVFCGKPKHSTSQRFCSFCGQQVVA